VAGVLGFLVFNFRKSARTFMGDTGSTVIGLIAAMSTARIIGNQPQLELTNGTLIPTFFMLVAVFWYPLFDSLQVYVRRLSRGNSPFVADRSHVHHVLLHLTNKNHLLTSVLIITGLLISISIVIWKL
jgi:UDP-GlcNAc:undecaprenyl-phosphate GlcNAc-1-phosphate transferase